MPWWITLVAAPVALGLMQEPRTLPRPPFGEFSTSKAPAGGAWRDREPSTTEPAWNISTLAGLKAFADAAEAKALKERGRLLLAEPTWSLAVPAGGDADFRRLILALMADPALTSGHCDWLAAAVDQAPVSVVVRTELVVTLLLQKKVFIPVLGMRTIDELSPVQLEQLWAGKGGDAGWESIQFGAAMALGVRADARIAAWANAQIAAMAPSEPSKTTEAEQLRWLAWNYTRGVLYYAAALPAFQANLTQSLEEVVADEHQYLGVGSGLSAVGVQLLLRRGLPAATASAAFRARLTSVTSGALVLPAAHGQPSESRTRFHSYDLRRTAEALGFISMEEFPTAVDLNKLILGKPHP
jgi:hypothetical protein